MAEIHLTDILKTMTAQHSDALDEYAETVRRLERLVEHSGVMYSRRAAIHRALFELRRVHVHVA